MVETIDAGRLRVYPALTGLRFIAALAVFLFHFGASALDHTSAPRPIVRLLHNGNIGVSLFFVLSGFILAHTYQHKLLNGRFLADFFLARWARIYPVYLLALLVVAPFTAPIGLKLGASVLLMLQAWSRLQSDWAYRWLMQAWTLSVEVLFYVLFPWILAGARRLNEPLLAALALASAGLIVAFGLSSVAPMENGFPNTGVWSWPILPVFRVAEFVYGVALCRLTAIYPRLAAKVGGNIAQSATAAAIVLLLALFQDIHSRGLATVLMGVLIVQLTADRGWIVWALSSSPMLLLGGASYSLYLMQAPIRSYCGYLIPRPFDKFVNPVIALAAAIAVFLFWEQPSRRTILTLYKRLNHRLPGAA